MTDFETTNRYKIDDILSVDKFDVNHIVSALHFDGKSKSYYLKRFQIETTTLNTPFSFISSERASKLINISLYPTPLLIFNYRLNNGDKKSKEIDVNTFIDIKGWKAIGNKIPKHKNMSSFKFLESKVAQTQENDSQETLTLF